MGVVSHVTMLLPVGDSGKDAGSGYERMPDHLPTVGYSLPGGKSLTLFIRRDLNLSMRIQRIILPTIPDERLWQSRGEKHASAFALPAICTGAAST